MSHVHPESAACSINFLRNSSFETVSETTIILFGFVAFVQLVVATCPCNERVSIRARTNFISSPITVPCGIAPFGVSS